MNIEISDEKIKKIEKFVKEGRYHSINAFFEQAAYLLIMAEENKDLWKRGL